MKNNNLLSIAANVAKVDELKTNLKKLFWLEDDFIKRKCFMECNWCSGILLWNRNKNGINDEIS